MLQFSVRVRPGASRTAVGGRYGEDALVVAVSAPAVDGAANRAVVDAVAAAFGVHRRAVEIVSGPASRTKRLAVEGNSEQLRARLAELLAAGDRRGQ